jgi:hypothetical protein
VLMTFVLDAYLAGPHQRARASVPILPEGPVSGSGRDADGARSGNRSKSGPRRDPWVYIEIVAIPPASLQQFHSNRRS